MQQSESLGSDIKTYEEHLARNPGSYLFARLAEIYLKAGLIEKALETTRQGVTRFPEFIAGQRAFAMACHAKGLREECRQALEKVTSAQPEDGEAQKMLGRIFIEEDNKEAAIRIFTTVLEFDPDDVECQSELDILKKVTSPVITEDLQLNAGLTTDLLDVQFVSFGEESEDDEIIKDIEIVEVNESDLIEEDDAALSMSTPVSLQSNASLAEKHDPLSTVTLAELYVQQGFAEKALEIYQSILSEDPGNLDVLSRLTRLESETVMVNKKTSPELDYIDESSLGKPLQAKVPEVVKSQAQGQTDDAVDVLEAWLHNIRRVKACR